MQNVMGLKPDATSTDSEKSFPSHEAEQKLIISNTSILNADNVSTSATCFRHIWPLHTDKKLIFRDYLLCINNIFLHVSLYIRTN
jgi:hypothetical protein